MVLPRPSLLAALAVAATSSLLCQCETVRTVKSTRSTGFTFDDRMWGGQGNADTDAIRSKFTEKGYTIAEDGSIKANKPDLFRDKKARGLDGSFQKKTSRFANQEAKTKEFRTPEYLKRQEFAGVSTARESGSSAREGNSTRSPDRATGTLFDKITKGSDSMNRVKTPAFRESGAVFETSADVAASAYTSAPRASGAPFKAGYQDNAALSMDDVKKMLNPGSYARHKGVSN